jgi:hypothetical protein
MGALMKLTFWPTSTPQIEFCNSLGRDIIDVKENREFSVALCMPFFLRAGQCELNGLRQAHSDEGLCVAI